jgi:hypothetical protein
MGEAKESKIETKAFIDGRAHPHPFSSNHYHGRHMKMVAIDHV